MKNEKKYFRVKYGYGALDFVSITENELDKAVYAQITGNPTQLGHSFVKGSNIISISPDWHMHTGWNELYEPKGGEDFQQIQRDCPNYDGVLEGHKLYVVELMESGNIKLIGKKDYEVEPIAIETEKVDSVMNGLTEGINKI